MQLQDADLTGAQLKGADLDRAHLHGANLEAALSLATVARYLTRAGVVTPTADARRRRYGVNSKW